MEIPANNLAVPDESRKLFGRIHEYSDMKVSTKPDSCTHSSDESRPKGLLEVAQEKCRLRHLSRFTEKQYLAWIRQFIRFHQKRHPRTMGEREIEQFLSYLAVQRNVAPSTQNQALNAIVFLYRHVLEMPLDKFKNIRWSKKRQTFPVSLPARRLPSSWGSLNAVRNKN